MFNRILISVIIFCVSLNAAVFATSSEKSGRTVVKPLPVQKQMVKPAPKKVIKIKPVVKPSADQKKQ